MWIPCFLIFILVSVVNFATGLLNSGSLASRYSQEFSFQFRAATVENPITKVETDKSLESKDTDKQEKAFEIVAGHATECLLQSDLRRDAGSGPQGTQGNWIHDPSAFVLKKSIDKMALKFAGERSGIDRDEASSWIRWMKSTPVPLLVNLSSNFQQLASEIISDQNLEVIGSSREEFLNRMECRIILLPSGTSLNHPLYEPPASIIYGKLLYGGATRYRIISSSNSNRPVRRAGERAESKTSERENTPVWMMYGGRDRNYDAIDMGPAAILEISLLPRRQGPPTTTETTKSDMSLNRIHWSPQKIFHFIDEIDNDKNFEKMENSEEVLGAVPSVLSGKSRNEAFKSDFKTNVGGLQPQIDSIVRRVLDGRVIRPADVIDGTNSFQTDETSTSLAMASADAKELALLGLTPVRGLLLYGPPGCGKTALAREISRALKARQPKIVSAPELLDRWVGGSERLIRQLFADAESELAACNGVAEKSALHVVVIDEIDAVFRKRSGGEDSGEVTRASAVNQILAKLDGVNAIPNILLIGMTNRPELLDEALLRPGRLEVQIEIPLPDKEGRREILRIHFEALRQRGRLSLPLCCAIEGVVNNSDKAENDNMKELKISSSKKRNVYAAALKRLIPTAIRPVYDLAGAPTAGFSGADIAGLVRCAGSLALSRARRNGNGVEDLLLTLEDVKQALKEMREI